MEEFIPKMEAVVGAGGDGESQELTVESVL